MADVAAWMPVVQVTVPIIAAIGIAAWLNNKRIDDLRSELRDFRQAVEATLKELQTITAAHDKRISVLEERTSPIARR